VTGSTCPLSAPPASAAAACALAWVVAAAVLGHEWIAWFGGPVAVLAWLTTRSVAIPFLWLLAAVIVAEPEPFAATIGICLITLGLGAMISFDRVVRLTPAEAERVARVASECDDEHGSVCRYERWAEFMRSDRVEEKDRALFRLHSVAVVGVIAPLCTVAFVVSVPWVMAHVGGSAPIFSLIAALALWVSWRPLPAVVLRVCVRWLPRRIREEQKRLIDAVPAYRVGRPGLGTLTLLWLAVLPFVSAFVVV